MPPFADPGVPIEELPSGTHPIAGVATSIAAFVGWADQGPTNQAVLVRSFADFQNRFGGLDSRSYLGYAVSQFFANGGQQAYIVRIVWDGSLNPAAGTTPKIGSVLSPIDGVHGDGNFEIALGLNPQAADFGIHLLDQVGIFNLLCVPGETDAVTIQNLQAYCNGQRAFCIVDSPQTATLANFADFAGPFGLTSSAPASLTTPYADQAAYYYPWVRAADPLVGNQLRLFPPCGFVAGIYAATDASRGVWKAPAGIDAGLTGVSGLQYDLTDAESDQLNVQAVNCLRQFSEYGNVVWGARTLAGNDQAGSQWMYVNVRRFALFLESSLYDGLQWVVFEPNNETLWGQIRPGVGSFLQGLFLQGAFQGATPQQAYFVKCDSENNPQSSVDQGIVNILVGFAPLHPAEFVVIQIQQLAGQASCHRPDRLPGQLKGLTS
jgi:phage tail sheath protein FI